MQIVSKFIGLIGIVTLAVACSEPAPEKVETEAGPGAAPLGAWIMYGGERGLLKVDAFR